MHWFYRDRFGDPRPYNPAVFRDPREWLARWDEDRRAEEHIPLISQNLDSPPRTFHSGPGKPESFGDMLALVTFGRGR